MAAFQLSPVVSVEYWRNTSSGIVRVSPGAGDAAIAHFAILMTAKPGRCGAWEKITARFELPAQADQLAVTLAAAEAAYSLGHHDRTNRMRVLWGLDRLGDLVPATRESYDRF